jgi:hypothetical protein
MVRTMDGAVHASAEEAKRHAEKRYADVLLGVVRQMLHMKYTEMAGYIDENLDKFGELQLLKRDIELEEPEEG